MIPHTNGRANHRILGWSSLQHQRPSRGIHQNSVTPRGTPAGHVILWQGRILFERIRRWEVNGQLVKYLPQGVQFPVKLPQPRLLEFCLVVGVIELLLAHGENGLPIDCFVFHQFGGRRWTITGNLVDGQVFGQFLESGGWNYRK